MHSREFTKPVTTESLLSAFESRFGQTLNLEGLDKTQLEDMANMVRTKIHTITDNAHFGRELKDDNYQKHQSMLDIVNQAIKEYGTGELKTDPKTKAIVKKVQNIPTLQDKEKKEIIGDLVTTEVAEGIEQQSELILAAKDMMDKVTGYLQDIAEMKTESMLELADRIRDEMGAEKADAYVAKIQPALESAETTLTQTREELDQGVRILTGEEIESDTVGADDAMNTDAEVGLDDIDTDLGVDDEFGAADASAGGTEPEGRAQRESREVFESSSRIYAKLAGK